MKRVWAAFAILVGLAAFSIWGHLAVNRAVDTMENELDLLQRAATQGEYLLAKTAADEVMQFCTKKEELLTLFLKRDLVNNLRINLAGLKAYISEDYLSDLLLEVDRARAQLHALHCQYYSVG